MDEVYSCKVRNWTRFPAKAQIGEEANLVEALDWKSKGVGPKPTFSAKYLMKQ